MIIKNKKRIQLKYNIPEYELRIIMNNGFRKSIEQIVFKYTARFYYERGMEYSLFLF